MIRRPAGLAAWIYENLYFWSDWKRSYGGTLNRDSILTTISVYWFTGTIYSSVRLYLESEKGPLSLGRNEKIDTPTAMVVLPAEMRMPPRSWVECGYNLVHWSSRNSLQPISAGFSGYTADLRLTGVTFSIVLNKCNAI